MILYISIALPSVVLIETLWNVKKEIEQLKQAGEQVLIETLWNVKQLSESQGIWKMTAY